MGRSKRNTKPCTKLEYPDFFAALEATTACTSATSASVAPVFGDSPTAFFENVASFGAAEHFRASASFGIAGPYETAALFGASSSVGWIEEAVDPFAQPVGLTPKYRGGRQKDVMVSPDERRKRDNHNKVERRRRQDIADKLIALQKHLKRPASTKKEIIMAALVQRQNDLEEIKMLESTLAGLEAMDSQYGL